MTTLPIADEKPKCSTCKYWELTLQLEENSFEGECKRWPPTPGDTPAETGAVILGMWPITFNGDWCGEWQAKPNSVLSTDVADLYDFPNAVTWILKKYIYRKTYGKQQLDYNLIKPLLLKDVIGFNSRELLLMNGLGPVALDRIRAALARHGLTLRGE